MNHIAEFFLAMLAAVFIENTIFTRALGTSRLLMVVRSPRTIFKFGALLTCITTVSGVISFFVNLLLKKLTFNLYVEPLCFVIILVAVYVLVCLVLYYFFKSEYLKLREILLLAVFNCATLGAILLPAHNSLLSNEVGFYSWVGFSFGTGIAFFLASLLVSEGIRKLRDSNIPKPFQGLPSSLIYIGILSLAFYGLIGHEMPF